MTFTIVVDPVQLKHTVLPAMLCLVLFIMAYRIGYTKVNKINFGQIFKLGHSMLVQYSLLCAHCVHSNIKATKNIGIQLTSCSIVPIERLHSAKESEFNSNVVCNRCAQKHKFHWQGSKKDEDSKYINLNKGGNKLKNISDSNLYSDSLNPQMLGFGIVLILSSIDLFTRF